MFDLLPFVIVPNALSICSTRDGFVVTVTTRKLAIPRSCMCRRCRSGASTAWLRHGISRDRIFAEPVNVPRRASLRI